MTTSVPPVTLLLVTQPGSSDVLLNAVVQPAARLLHASVRTATAHPDDRSAADALAARLADAVVLDCRDGWTPAAGHTLGVAEALHVPTLALVAGDDGPVRLGPTTRALDVGVDFDDASSVRAAADRLRQALDDLLPARPDAPTPRPPEPAGASSAAAGTGRGSQPDGLPDFDRAAAEQLMVALYLDGLGPESIANELVRRGAPESWVRSRTARRPGW